MFNKFNHGAEFFGFPYLTKWLETNNINIKINISSEPKATGARVPNLGHVIGDNPFVTRGEKIGSDHYQVIFWRFIERMKKCKENKRSTYRCK